jgi:amino-acid N-acetyltransferase
VGVVDGVDYGFTGTVRKVIAEEIAADLDQQNVVLMSPLGVSPAGEIFNMSMEAVAEAVAIALKAEKLIYLCDAPGLLDSKGGLIEAITADDAEAKLKAGEGMTEDLDLYLPCAIRAVRQGVGRAHLIDRDKDGGLLLEFFTPQGVGTVLTRDPLFRLREATIEDVGALGSVIAPMEADGTLVRRSRERLEEEIERFTVVEYDGVLVGLCGPLPLHRRAGGGDGLRGRGAAASPRRAG